MENELKTLLIFMGNVQNKLDAIQTRLDTFDERLKACLVDNDLEDFRADIHSLRNDISDLEAVQRDNNIEEMIADAIAEHESDASHMSENDVDERVNEALEEHHRDFDHTADARSAMAEYVKIILENVKLKIE